MQGFFGFVKSLGAPRLAAMAAVTLTLIGFFYFIMVQMTTLQMAPIFTNLPMDNTAAIAKDLDGKGITYKIKGNGSIIVVPRNKAERLRMSLAEEGLPRGGGVGYEIFDKSDTLGATTFVQNINRLRALEGELARTICTLDKVEAVRVLRVLTSRPLFSHEKVEASATIVPRVNGTLSGGEVCQRQSRRAGRYGKSAVCRTVAYADQYTERLDELPSIHQRRHHARGQSRRDGAAQSRRPIEDKLGVTMTEIIKAECN